MASNTSSPLYRLPNELLLQVLQQCSDFSTLWGLINASVRLRAVFTVNAVSVLQDVLLAADVPDRTRTLMLAVVHIRNEPFLMPAITEESIILGEDSGTIILPAYYVDAFARAPARILRRFVALAHHIHVLAHATLDRCRSALVAAAARTALGVPSKAAQLPSWLEEQQAQLAFWHLQVLSGITTAVLNGRVMRQLAGVSTVAVKGVVNEELILTALEQIQWEDGGGHDGALPPLPLRVTKWTSGPYEPIMKALSFLSYDGWPSGLLVKINAPLEDTLSACTFVLKGCDSASLVLPDEGEAARTLGTQSFHPDDQSPAKAAIYWILHSFDEASRLPALPHSRLHWPCASKPEKPAPTTEHATEPDVPPDLAYYRRMYGGPSRSPRPTLRQPGDVPLGMVLFKEECKGMSCSMRDRMGDIPYQPFGQFRRLGFMLWDGTRLSDSGFCEWPDESIDLEMIGEWKRVLGWKKNTPASHIGRKHFWGYRQGDSPDNSDSESEWAESVPRG